MNENQNRGKHARRAALLSGSALTALILSVVAALNVVLFILVDSLGLYLYSEQKDDLTLSGSTDALFADAIDKGEKVKISFCNTEDVVSEHSTGKFVYETAKYFEERYPGFIELEFINIITHKNSKGETVPISKYTKDMKGNETPIYKTSVIFESKNGYKVLTDTYSTAGYAGFFTLDSSGNATSYNGEEIMAAMISWVLHTEHKTAYFTKHHGEEVDVSMSDLLTAAGYYVDVIDLRRTEVPSDAALLVISNPSGDFERAAEGSGIRSEIERLKTYLDKGGNILVTLDPYVKTLPTLENFLLEYGIGFSVSEGAGGKLVRNMIKDPRAAITTDGFTLVTDLSEESVGVKMKERIDSFTDGDVILREVSALELSGNAKPLLVSSSASVLEAGGKTVSEKGSFTAAAYNVFAAEQGTSSVIVVPSIYLAVSDSLVTNGYSNKEFLFSLFEVVYGQEGLPYGCKTVLYNTNTLENLTMGTAKAYLAVAMLLPIGVAVCGAVVLIRRKNR